MAQAATTRKRPAAKPATTANAADFDAAAAAAQNEAAQAASAQAAADEARNEQLLGLRGRLTDGLTTLKNADKASAIEARELWVNVGNLLIEGRSLFIAAGSNAPDDRAFGKWIDNNGFKALGAGPTRSAAIWLAEVYNKKPDLYALFPTESVAGEPLRRSPRTLQSWVRDQVVGAFQDAWEADKDGIGIAADAEKDARANVAAASVSSVYNSLLDRLAVAAENMETAHAATAKAKAAERAAAMATYENAAAVHDALLLQKDILDQLTTDERLDYFVRWHPKHPPVAFKEKSVDDAAKQVFALLASHESFSAVYEAVGVLVAAKVAAVQADAGEVDPEAGDDNDFDFDFDEAEDVATDDVEDEAEAEDDEDVAGEDFPE